MFPNPLRLIQLYRRGQAAARYAAARGMPGMEFDRFGRQLGRRLLLKGVPVGLVYWLAPVSIVRYFEFAFALACLPGSPEQYLDVSSPRLFSLYVASQHPSAHLRMINPDAADLARTAAIVTKLGLSRIDTQCCGVEALLASADTYDCLWAISVVEHISGACSDGQAVKLIYDVLKAGGRLILTVPVDRQFRDEYRDRDYYGTQVEAGGRYFFQHLYDSLAIQERLLAPIGKEPNLMRWFGETTPGRFTAHEQRWQRVGWPHTVEDAREIADHYREFRTWADMPGIGVCGLMIEKPKA